MDQILPLIQSHAWLALSALIIGMVVRMLKADGPIPINIPPRWRAPLAFALGIVAGVLQAVLSGAKWQDAIASGLLSAFIAMGTHDLVIQSARKGREIGESKPSFTQRTSVAPPPPATDAK